MVDKKYITEKPVSYTHLDVYKRQVLDAIKNGPVPVVDLYKQIRPLLDDATDFMSVMDCLYALGATDINDEGEVFICL